MNIAQIFHPDCKIEAYADNILIEACGTPLSPSEIAKRLTYLPPHPCKGDQVPPHFRRHQVASILRMHIPTAAGIGLVQGIDLMMRQGYVHRRPSDAATWRFIYSGGGFDSEFSAVQLAATVTGISGAGKTTAIERALAQWHQVVVHEKFPGLVGPVRQLLWLKIDVPGSGKIVDLVESLVRATDRALGTQYAAELLGGRPKRGASLAHEWLGKVACHFPGLLVLDEIQNLFKIEALRVRRSYEKKDLTTRPPLRIADDETLKFVLTLTNTSKIPILVCGTPDGINAFGTRMSTAQRLVTAGFHHIPHTGSSDDNYFRKILFPRLCEYQWFEERLPATDGLRKLIHNLSGGVPRIYIALWIHAHYHALARSAKCLNVEDFHHASLNALGPLRPAIEVLLSNDPRRLMLYEDMMPVIKCL